MSDTVMTTMVQTSFPGFVSDVPTVPSVLPVVMGDVIFTRWKAFSSRLTEWVTHGKAAHVEQVCCDNHGEVQILAASMAMDRMVCWDLDARIAYFEKEKIDWCRFTPAVPLTFEQRRILHNFIEEAQNTFTYSRGELILQAMDSFKNWICNTPYDSQKAVWFRKLGNIKKTDVICSKTVNIGLVRLEFFPEWAQFWSPSDTLNKIQSSTSWKLAEATPGFFGEVVKVEPIGSK